MLTYENNYVPEAIRNAQEGSLLHNLTEKIAYGIYQKHLQREQNSNWFTAQIYFEKWLIGRFGEYIYPLSNFLERMLQPKEKSLWESGQKVDDIKYSLANIIIDVNHLFQ